MAFPDVIGLIGVALYVGAYAGLQLGLLGLSDVRYSALNAVGGVAVIYSLIWSFNLAAFVTQVLWLAFTSSALFVRDAPSNEAAFCYGGGSC